MKGYTDGQTKELLSLAAKGRSKGVSLSKVFENYAEICGKAKGSIRNYYYFLVKEAKNNGALVEKYPELGGFLNSQNVSFTKDEEQELINKVNEGVMQGKSIRRTIMELSGGDQKLALRYQNKYRNMCKNISPDKRYPKDRLFDELSGKINDLVMKIGKTLRDENEKLKQKNKELSDENKKLKKQISMGIIEKYFTEQGGAFSQKK